VFYSSFVGISVYANVYFKTTLRECLRAGLPPGFPSTVPPPVRVSAVLADTLAVWIPNQKKKTAWPVYKASYRIRFCGNGQIGR